jgi:hypothetical protein
MAFTAGARLTAQLLNNQFQPLQAHSPLDSGTVTNTSYTQTRSGAAAPVGIAFVAPTSGIVRVYWHCAIRNSNAANFGLCALGIRTGGVVGSGTDYVTASDAIALQQTPNTADIHMGMSHPVGGLTPLATYNAVLWFRVNGNTGTFSRCSIDVVPAS